MSEYVELDSKSVLDSDGFYTDYTLYRCEDEYGNLSYVCVFGDKDLYTPEDGEYDFETEDEDEAYEWFESYEGFDDADIESCDGMKKAKITASTDDLRDKINNKVDEAVIMLEENIMHDVAAAIPEYDPDWCAEDLQFNYEEAREAFINSMVDDILLAYRK